MALSCTVFELFHVEKSQVKVRYSHLSNFKKEVVSIAACLWNLR